jgi:hypothetical protein
LWQQWRRWRDGKRKVWGAAMALARRRGPASPWSAGDAVDGHDRRPDRPGRASRTDVPQRRRPPWPDDRGEAEILVDIIGLPVAAPVDPAKPDDVRAGRELLDERVGDFPRVQAVVADSGS